MNTLLVTNNTNYEFAVVIVKQGEKYGLDNCLVHEENKPLVEFYATKTNQFISSYYADTLLQGTSGLCLDGYNAEVWSIDYITMQYVRQWIAANI